MTDEKKPSSKVSIVKSKTNIDDRGHGTVEYINLEAESQTDDGAWTLFEKLSAHSLSEKVKKEGNE
jgi:hypothetical protein